MYTRFTQTVTTYVAYVLSALLVSLYLGAMIPQAQAHEDPVNCNASGLQQFPSVGPSGTVYDGEMLTYAVIYTNTDPDGAGPVAPCNITNADATIMLPDGTPINVLTNATLNVGDTINCPGDAACAAGPYTYTVDHADEAGVSVTAEFSINGVLHQDADEEEASDFDTLSKTVIHPSTDLSAGVDLSAVVNGTEVTLTITDTNDGDVDLTNPFVDLQPLGLTLDETSAEFQGTDIGGDGILGVGETWTWTVTDTPAGDTSYTATGHGTTPLGDDVTWCEDPAEAPEGVLCDQDERDTTRVSVTNPSTLVDISASADTVDVGGTVDLTVTETNDGDVALDNVSVVVNDGSSDIATLTAPPDSGDTGADGILGVGETWTWAINGVVITADTTFTATGSGDDALGNTITWCDDPAEAPEGVLCDQDERASTDVEVQFNPSTDVSADVNLELIHLGDEVMLTITETNDGDVALTDAYVDLSPLGLTLDETSPTFLSDGNNDSTLDVGETWTWTVTDTPAGDVTYVAIGHGTDSEGNDVTWCEDPAEAPEGVLCDQDERAAVGVDVIEPSTVLTADASELEVAAGTEVTLTFIETNDGDVDLTDPYIEVDNGLGTFDETSPEFAGTDTGGDGILSPGETWQWDIVVTIDADITYTAVGHGTDPLGTDITYPLDPDEQASVTITTVFEGCTLTQGYWKTHSEYGPATPADETWDAIGGPDADLLGSGMFWIDVFNTAPKGGNVWYQLAHQWMAATLNVEAGASVPGDVQDALTDAEAWLADPAHAPATNPKAKDYPEAGAWASLLAAYNEGEVGPGHCD